MKKNVLKRFASAVIAGAMTITMLPAFASGTASSGASGASSSTATGEIWTTIADIKVDSFEGLRDERAFEDTKTIDGREYTLKADNEDTWAKHGWLKAHKLSEAPNGALPTYTGVGEYAVMGASGRWYSYANTSCETYWKLSNIYGSDTVAVGDKVKVSAAVYGRAPAIWNASEKEATVCEETVTEAALRMTAGGNSEYKTIAKDSWHTISMEFEITEDNISNNFVKIDGCAKTYTEPYMRDWFLGNVKVEKLTTVGGNYTVSTGKKWQSLYTIKMDSFDAVRTERAFEDTKIIDGREYTLKADNEDTYAMHSWTKAYTLNDAPNGALPAYDSVGDYVVMGASGRWYSYATSSCETYWKLSNLYDSENMQAGDRVRISAAVYGRVPCIWNPTDKTAAVQEGATKGALRITSGGNSEYNVMSADAWHTISLAYTVTAADLADNFVKIDGCAKDYNNPYLRDWFLGSVTVEKEVDDPTSPAGVITGKVTIGVTDTVAADADYRVLVAAYKGDLFLGCDIMNYTALGDYDFEIEDAIGTDKVVAYLWDMNDYEPQLVPVNLTYKAQ